MSIRTYRVAIRGFDCDAVYVRATSRSRAKYLSALSFSDAGWGTIADGLRCVTGVRLAPEESDRPLCSPRRGPEGMCVSDYVAAATRRAQADFHDPR